MQTRDEATGAGTVAVAAEDRAGSAGASGQAGLLVGGHGPLTAGLAAALGERWTTWRSPGLPAPLAGGPFPRPVVYLAADRAPHGLPDADDAAVVLAAAARAGAPRVVVIASTLVHEPSPHHPGLVEESRLRPRRTGNLLAAAWVALERAAAAAVPPPRLLLLRAAPVPLPGAGDLWSREVFARVAATPFGRDPMVQLLALEDLAAALRACLAADLTGTFHVAPPPAPARKAVRSAGAWRLAVPTPLWSLARRLGGLPAAELPALVHPATVSAAALERATGFSPRWSTLQAARRNQSGESETRGDVVEQPTGGGRPRNNRDEEPGPVAAEDPFGFDLHYRQRLGRTLFRFLHDVYWRVDAAGVEHVPAGRAVLVGVHRGFQPWDGVMVQQIIAASSGRYVRFLQHPGLVKLPVIAPYMTRIGGLPPSRENAAWVLENEGLLGIFPEGIRGAFSFYRHAYEITPWFRDDFAAVAIRHRAPVVPWITVGTAETFPILGRLDWEWWKRLSLWPFLPLTTPIPLPAKWHLRILPPVPVDRYAPGDADDPQAVAALAAEVRDHLTAALAGTLARRRHRFFGKLRPERQDPR